MNDVVKIMAFRISRINWLIVMMLVILYPKLGLRADDGEATSSNPDSGITSSVVFAEDKPKTTQVREAIQRSIPYIEEKGLWWIEKKKCVSCHRVGTMLWSLREAKRNGFKVSEKLDEWFNWATDASLSKNDKGKLVGLGNREGVVQILFSFDPNNLDPGQSETRKKLIALLNEGQQSEGSWKPGGQLPSQKRSKSETMSVTTMWLTLALLVEENNKDTQVVERALKYIAASSSGKSVEWYALRLLLAEERKETGLRDQTLNKLLSQQKPDGGWGWIVDEESDALGTGMALYALLRAGLKRQDNAIKRAQQFLISTQRKDGSWPVRGTKEKKKDRVQETAVFWGTTWAVIGLVESLPEEPK
ncbi:Prenyltransferase and squalene oxidase repeat protein [Gimesia aquarii]|uniref:Prenyltransferase and squalene oxidase repeat protein n=2 Tax=Gimesia aquarii TaxID=2527964 RepID=A0A517WYT3_9PLAN|nr:Prenyltransferase and squalene oxidase repeat protein [Gimesia aquarii]